LSASDNSKIVAWLTREGFTINDIARGHNWVAFSGTAGQVSQSLHTSIHRFEVRGKMHFANTSDPAIPAALADVIGGILGLDDFSPARDAAVVNPAYTTSNGGHLLTPQDFATIYDVNPLYNAGFDGSGQSIVIIGEGGMSLDDVHQFRNTFGLPANDPIAVPYSTQAVGTALETSLDIEWSGAIAPRAQIYYVYGTSAISALTYAINMNIAPIISTSYGENESSWVST
jgi:subtilase family serine protease